LASPDLALELLRCSDFAEGERLSAELEQLNIQRRQLQRAGAQEASATVSDSDLESDRVLVVLGEDWHLGVIGLIAGTLAESHARPAVVCTGAKRDGTYVGSARSIAAYDIVQGISACSDYLETYGGHPAAAGFSLKAERFEEFRVRLLDHANAQLTPRDMEPELHIDLLLRDDDIGLATLGEMARLEPFGKGHEPPLFAATDLQVVDCKRIGQKGDHLKLALRTGEATITAVRWRKGELAKHIAVGDRVNVAFELENDTYARSPAAQMVIKDMYTLSVDDHLHLSEEKVGSPAPAMGPTANDISATMAPQ